MALNSPNTVAANRRPRPRAVQRSRGEKSRGLSPIRSHSAMPMRPTTLRHDSKVSTSPPAAKTTLPRTSEQPKAAAATMPGPRRWERPDAGRDDGSFKLARGWLDDARRHAVQRWISVPAPRSEEHTSELQSLLDLV